MQNLFIKNMEKSHIEKVSSMKRSTEFGFKIVEQLCEAFVLTSKVYHESDKSVVITFYGDQYSMCGRPISKKFLIRISPEEVLFHFRKMNFAVILKDGPELDKTIAYCIRLLDGQVKTRLETI